MFHVKQLFNYKFQFFYQNEIKEVDANIYLYLPGRI